MSSTKKQENESVLGSEKKAQKTLRSEESQEIIEHKSNIMERGSLWIFLFIFLLLLSGSAFVRFPDILQTRATLTSRNGPKDIVPFQSGRVTDLFFENGQYINSGETIAYIESAANPQQVVSLSKRVDSAIHMFVSGNLNGMSTLFTFAYGHLGEIQTSYQTFITALQQFNDFYTNGFYTRKKQMLAQDLIALRQMNNSLDNQRILVEQDNKLAEESYKMNKKLFEEKVISAEELRVENSKLLNKEGSLPQINNGLLSNQNQQRDKLKELEQVDHDVVQQRTTLQQALQTLKSALDSWMKQYVIVAPVDGILSFTKPLQQNQYINSGKSLGYVVPKDNKLFAELYLPQNNLGKADTGMTVQLRFDAYPYQENGTVNGKLEYLSKVVSDSGYLGIVKIDNTLLTTQHKNLPIKDGLKADALVITKDMSLLRRLYYNIVKGMSVNK